MIEHHTQLYMFQPSRFQRLFPVLPFDLEISRFEGSISKFSIFCKNSNMYRTLLRLLLFNCVYIEIQPVFAVTHRSFCKEFAEK